MLLAGLTGGIASGKSLVARVFRDLGAHVIDADRIVHDLTEQGREAWQEMVDYFGEGILLPGGTLDRRAVGEIVFRDAEKRAWLNACLHPRVFSVVAAQVRQIGAHEADALIIFDAALLIETGYHRTVDRTVVVYATEDQQRERLQQRDGLTREQADARIASQMPLAEKRKLADYVIDNTGSREETEAQARALFPKLTQEAERTR